MVKEAGRGRSMQGQGSCPDVLQLLKITNLKGRLFVLWAEMCDLANKTNKHVATSGNQNEVKNRNAEKTLSSQHH
jgi:hypothetical protein